MLIAQIGNKLAAETIKHHPNSHSFLPKRGVETFMKEFAKLSELNPEAISIIAKEIKQKRMKDAIDEIIHKTQIYFIGII